MRFSSFCLITFTENSNMMSSTVARVRNTEPMNSNHPRSGLEDFNPSPAAIPPSNRMATNPAISHEYHFALRLQRQKRVLGLVASRTAQKEVYHASNDVPLAPLRAGQLALFGSRRKSVLTSQRRFQP